MRLICCLGQVYRGRLRGMRAGQEVAVKVQRPGVAGQAALDLYLLRGAARMAAKLLKLR